MSDTPNEETVGELAEDAKKNGTVSRGPWRIEYVGTWNVDAETWKIRDVD